jgi:4-hydroxybenzoate polyprenyltransferase
MRPHQWAKNLLVFVPLALTPELNADGSLWLVALGAFAALCAVASGGYLINDLVDLESDRSDPEKRERPLANGAISPRAGAAGGLASIALGFAVALWATPAAYVAYLAGYLALSLAYSFWLKRQLLIDVLVLAGLYTLRLLAGGAAVGIPLTPWLLAFSMFLFLGLAYAKRFAELRRMNEALRRQATGRAYRIDDLGVVLTLGATSSYLAVLVLCLYVSAEAEGQHYAHAERLWLLVPVLLYWVSRIWFLVRRGEISGDVVAFAVRDPASLVCGAGMVLAVLAASVVG